ncbi:unnamed protein product [Rhodiola kirilowii]
MDPNDARLNSYYHHHHHHSNQHQQHHQSLHQQQQSSPSPAAGVSPPNGPLPKPESGGPGSASTPSPLTYTQSVQPSIGLNSTDGAVRRKRGRPRKYGTPEQALAAKKATSTSSAAQGSQKKRDSGVGYVTKKSQQLSGIGNAGQGFTTHVIDAAEGEDVFQKIMRFMQQIGREICILSASGSISNASLRQPATSGGGITYKGRFELLSLSGSYVRTENGERSGGLSVCLSDMNGQIIGGGIGGPLVAAGPVQVIVGSFQIVPKKDSDGGAKGDSPASQQPSSLASASMSSGAYRPTAESAGRVQNSSNEEHQHSVINPFMVQSRNVHTAPPQATDWMGGSYVRSGGSYEFLGRADRVPFRSPENGDYNQMPDQRDKFQ